MPKRPASKPAMSSLRYVSALQGNGRDTVEWPKDFFTDDCDGNEAIQVGWWNQLRELSADELRVLAFSALKSVESLEAQRYKLRSEIERRDQVRTQRGKAAQLPAVEEFKTWVKGEWELAHQEKSRGALTGFACRVISRKGAPITDTKTVLRWCREWKAERSRAARRSYPLYESDGTPHEDVYEQVGLCREPIPFGDNSDPTKPPVHVHLKRF